MQMSSKQNLIKLPWPAWLIIALALLLTLLPAGLRIGAEYALENFGAESAQIENIDLNLFTGHFAVEGLKVNYARQPTLSVDAFSINLNMLSLPRKRILVDTFTLSGVDLKIFQQQQQWIIGLPLPDPASNGETDAAQEEETQEPDSWQFGIHQFSLQDIALDASYQGNHHSLALKKFSAAELLMWTPDEQSRFSLAGSINNAPLQLNSDLQPFAETQTVAVQIKLDKLQLSPLQDFLPEDISKLAAQLSLDTAVQLALQNNGDIHIVQDGTIAVTVNELAMAAINIAANDIRWQGQTDVAIAANQQAEIHAEGTASLNRLQTDYQPLRLSARLADLQWQGKAGVDLADSENSLTSSGTLQLDKLQLHDTERQADLLNLARLALDDMRINGLADLQIAALTLEQINAMQNGESALGRLDAVNMDNIQLAQMNALNIEAVGINALNIDLVQSPQGNIEVLESWLADLKKRQHQAASESATEPGRQASADDTENTAPFSYAIGNIQFNGDSLIRFTDKATSPAIVHPLVIEKINIGTISSTNTATPTAVEVALKLYDHGSFNLDGNITVLKPVAAMDGKLTADIKGIELTDLSPYIENAIGYQANSGQANISSQASITNGQLDSTTEVRVLRIDLQPVNQELIAKAGKKLAMPVNTALAAITNSDNTLKLTVPANGDLSRPDISVERIMAGALTQAVKNSAMTYFKYAVQPFGAIVLVSQKIGDMQLQARFEDVRFQPGQAAIVDEQSGYLEKVAGMIEAKKDFSVLVCVMITDQDFQAMGSQQAAEEKAYQWDKNSETLARERLQLIRSTLINEHGLDADQVQSCKPQLDSGIPRAVMGI